MKSFVNDLIIQLNNYFNTITPKPKFEQGTIGLTEGYYLVNVDTDSYSQQGTETTVAIALKHQEVQTGRGIMEAEVKLKNLSEYLNENYLVRNEQYKYIGKVDSKFIVYNYMFTI